MRTTLQTINQKILTNLNKITTDMAGLNSRISSGKQMSKLSDNPVNLVSALNMRTQISQVTKYGDNLRYGDSIITASENALTQIKDLVVRAKALNLQDVNATLTAADRENAAEEIRQLFEQAVTLANTQISGKYIFGGYKTTGYSEEEPTPFIVDLVDGYRVNGRNLTAMNVRLTGTVDNAAINAGDLTVNGNAVGAIGTAAAVNGLNMTKAANAKTEIMTADPTVTAALTTLYSSGVAAVAATADTDISFDVNGVNVSVVYPNLTTAANVAAAAAAAINGVSGQTGIEAVVGDGTNGGALNEVVFRNIEDGEEANITVTNFTVNSGNNDLGFTNFDQGADATHNTGRISLSSDATIVLDSPNHTDDTVLNSLGLGGGGKGLGDEAGDGALIYGYRLAAGDLTINGVSVGAAADDGVSTIFAAESAAAKAAAINAVADETGVSAEATPLYRFAQYPVDAGTLDTGDLLINGVDIFAGGATAIVDSDNDNVLLTAINAKTDQTGITAGRNSAGQILLTAADGRNLYIQTSANGESITHLNGGLPAQPQGKVYFGSLRLSSDRRFLVESTPTANYEPGLATIGLDGGESFSGETGDVAGDGEIAVAEIVAQEGNVRYTGDPDNDIAIQIGESSTLTISKNGKSGLADTGVFQVLKKLEDSLRGQNYTSVTANYQVTDTSAVLDSGDTGLELVDELANGTFSITVADHYYSPPTSSGMSINVDPAVDTLDSIAAKLNGVPGIDASLDADGYLHIDSADSDRYTFSLADQESNFLRVIGINSDDMQVQALQESLSDLEDVLENITSQISDFGARANRIQVQTSILNDLEQTTTENLSEVQDTDLTKAIMDLQAKEISYQAALSAAAKTMQLSLVNYL